MNLKEIAERGAKSLASDPKNELGTSFAYGTIQSVSDGLATVYVNGGILEGVPMVAGTENAKPASRCIVMTIGRLSTVIAVIGTIENEVKVLWSGSGWYMDAAKTCTLSEPLSAQRTGIVLHWQGYSDGVTQDSDHNYFFVPKSHASEVGNGVSMLLTNSSTRRVASKYVYVYDDRITGNDQNTRESETIADSNITIWPKYFVLTEILGV